MSQTDRMKLFAQYRQTYGDLSSDGKYSVGDRVYFHGDNTGEIIWKYQGTQGLVYVVDNNSGFPVEVDEYMVTGKVTVTKAEKFAQFAVGDMLEWRYAGYPEVLGPVVDLDNEKLCALIQNPGWLGEVNPRWVSAIFRDGQEVARFE